MSSNLTIEEMAKCLICSCGEPLIHGGEYAGDELLGFMCIECGVGYSPAEIRAKYAEMKGAEYE